MARNVTPVILLKQRQRQALALRWGGIGVGILGGLAALTGAALPWAMVTAFGVPLSLPGVLTWGAASGLLALVGLLTLRPFPLIACIAGALCAAVSLVMRDVAPREMMMRVVRIERAIAPVNERMAQIALSPIEPFSGIGPASRYQGIGPPWCLWGGVVLASGGAAAAAGIRRQRSCAHCGSHWPPARSLRFCPSCGAQALPQPLCSRCHAPLEKGDRFCGECGKAENRH